MVLEIIGKVAMWGTMSFMRLSRVIGAGLLLALLGATPGHAGNDRDHERARRAVEAGEVLPLQTILKRIEPEYPGQVMDVELDRDEGRWIYEIKVLRAGGSLVKLKVDARDGTVLGSRTNRAGGKKSGDLPSQERR